MRLAFTTSNSYEGIPDPTAADAQALISKFGVEQFMGNYYFNRIVGKVESIGLAAEPKFEWHTPNSVSFNVRAVYTERTNDVGGKERLGAHASHPALPRHDKGRMAKIALAG